MPNRAPQEIVDRRVRNGMISYWAWLSDATAQDDYQQRIPNISISDEAFNQWEDWQPYPSPAGRYAPPIYSPEESETIARFHSVWNEVAEMTPNPMPPLEDLGDNPHWRRLMREAGTAYRLFMRRGRLSEEIEEAEQGGDGDAEEAV